MGHTTHTITNMYRGKSTTKEFILYKIQSILHVKILFYNFNSHSTGFKNYNTGKKINCFHPLHVVSVVAK